jgi:quaternary ammonium compound-resistance protein SugE
MSWVFLILAGLFEIAWPIGLKLAQGDDQRVLGLNLAVIGMAVSGYLPLSGAKGNRDRHRLRRLDRHRRRRDILRRRVFFGDTTSLLRYLGVILIIAGVAALKLAQ